jgi:predicted transcriptional regulator
MTSPFLMPNSSKEIRMKLPRSSFKILRLILLGYLHEGGSARKPTPLQALARATGLATTVISSNNGSLSSLGLIERSKGGTYSLTQEGSEFARALEFDEAELMRRSAYSLLAGDESVNSVLNKLRIRGPMPVDQFLNHLVFTSGEPKTPATTTGARAFADLLALAGLISLDGDRVELGTPSISPPPGKPSADDLDAIERTAAEAEPAAWTPVQVVLQVTAADLVDPERLELLIAALRRLTTQGESE